MEKKEREKKNKNDSDKVTLYTLQGLSQQSIMHNCIFCEKNLILNEIKKKKHDAKEKRLKKSKENRPIFNLLEEEKGEILQYWNHYMGGILQTLPSPQFIIDLITNYTGSRSFKKDLEKLYLSL